MAATCLRPADCLAGNMAFLDARRGVRGAPAPALRRQMQQQDTRVPTTTVMAVPGQSRPVRGRPIGRQRGRRSPPAPGSPAQKRVMENVVILKRGEPIPTMISAKSGAQAEKDESGMPVAAAEQSSAQTGTAEPAASEQQPQSSVQAGIAEPMAAADQRAASATDATNVTKAKVVATGDRCVPHAKDGKNVAAAAKPNSGQSTKAGAALPAVYWGPPFTSSPEPHELPIPSLLLKDRGARLGPRDDERAAAA